MKRLYTYRGFVLGFFAVLLLLFSPGEARVFPSFVFLICGIFLRVEARTVIGNHSRGKNLEAPSLLTTGIYSQIRHPLYVSNSFLSTGLILLYWGWNIKSLVFILGVCFWFLLLSRNEDHFLKEKFGSRWTEWKKKTPAFFPKIRSHTLSGSIKTSRLQAFMQDCSTWFWLLIFSLLIIMRKY